MQCKLYKMLVYGEGGHFMKHQDTEKEDRMVATMVVQLPSLHEGGDLVVYRNGEVKHRHEFGKKEETAAYLPHYVVHFVDAEHALEEVTKRYRLLLVYSICLLPTMRHLMKNNDERLDEELGAVIDNLGAENNSFALLLAHEYTAKSIEELGAGALKSVDRTRFRTLVDANDTVEPGKNMLLFIAKLQHDISYYDDGGGSWVENARHETITWYFTSGQKLGDSRKVNIQLYFLNPGEETLSELWTPHGNSTFEGYLGNEGATKDTAYSRFAIVAWPAANGVENAFEFINVNATVESLQCQRPVDSATVREFMKDVSAKLVEKKKERAWPRPKGISTGFCVTLCEILVEVGDPALVHMQFDSFMSNLGKFKKKEKLVAPLTALIGKFAWIEIGRGLMESLRRPAHRHGHDEQDDSTMKLALQIVDGLEGGDGQRELLKFASEKAVNLGDEYLCSFKLGLLWKWVIQCGDKAIFDLVAAKFQQTKPNLLQSVIEAFSQHIGGVDASDDRFDVLASIAKRRIDWLNNQLQALGKPFSWVMPDAYFPDNASVQAFLRGPDVSMNASGVRHFNGVSHARNYAKKWMREKQVDASFKLEPDGRGQSAYVVITKTKAWFSQYQTKLLEYKAESSLLSDRFRGAASGPTRKRARHE